MYSTSGMLRTIELILGLSAHFDLSKADAVPDALLNEVLWKSIKGENSTAPAPRRSAFVRVKKDD